MKPEELLTLFSIQITKQPFNNEIAYNYSSSIDADTDRLYQQSLHPGRGTDRSGNVKP
jgi:hypothetical protein